MKTLTILLCAILLAAVCSRQINGQEPKVGHKRLAGDGVNVETYQGNGIWSSTLAMPTDFLKHDSITTIHAYSHDDYVRDMGRWPLTKAEGDELVTALKDSTQAHVVALGFYVQALESFGPTATKEDREKMISNAQRCRDSSMRALAMLQKWEQRVAKLKD